MFKCLLIIVFLLLLFLLFFMFNCCFGKSVKGVGKFMKCILLLGIEFFLYVVLEFLMVGNDYKELLFVIWLLGFVIMSNVCGGIWLWLVGIDLVFDCNMWVWIVSFCFVCIMEFMFMFLLGKFNGLFLDDDNLILEKEMFFCEFLMLFFKFWL